MAIPVATNGDGATSESTGSGWYEAWRDVIYLPLPFVDASEGGWCSDKPRSGAKSEGSWVDFDGVVHPTAGVYEEEE